MKRLLDAAARRRGLSVLTLALAALVLGTTAVQAVSLPPSIDTSSVYNQQFSPDGDGQDDSLSATFCLSAAANVTARVVDESGAVVRVLLVGRSFPSGCTTQVEWDGAADSGAPVPDGSYELVVNARNDAPTAGETSVEVQVDRRVPGTVTSPTPDAGVSGAAVFTFTPTTGVPVDAVAFALTGNAVSCSSTWLRAADDDGVFRLEWDTAAECGDGPRTLTAQTQWTDAFGRQRSWTSPAQRLTLLNPAAPTLTLRPVGIREFAPGASGRGEVTSLRWCAEDSAEGGDVRTVVEVLDAAGDRVRLLSDATQAPTPYCSAWWGGGQYLDWDGAGDDGTQVPDGTYTVRATSTDATGLAGTEGHEVVVDRRPVGSVTSPAAGGSVSGLVDLVFEPRADLLMRQVSFGIVGTGGEYCYPPTVDAAAADGTWRQTVDSAAECGEGPRQLTTTVAWTDRFGDGQATSWSQAVVLVNPAAPRVTVTSNGTREFAPAAQGRNEPLYVRWCAVDDATAGDVRVTVRVVDGAGATVRTLRDEVLQPEGRCDLYWGQGRSEPWDGAADDGAQVPDGEYVVRVTATDPGGLTATVDTDVLTVDRREPGSLTAPGGTTLSGPTEVAFTPTDDLVVQDVTVSLSSPSSSCNVRLAPSATGGPWRATLDTATDCGDGPRQLTATASWYDRYGSGHSWSETRAVVLDNPAAPAVDVELSGPRVIAPGPAGRSEALTVRWCASDDASSGDAHTLVEVLDAGGAPVRLLRDLTGPLDGQCSLPWGQGRYELWDGADDAGQQVSDGEYAVRVTSTDATGRTGADVSDVVEVDRRLPGELMAPAPGATVAGAAPFVFRPTDGIEVTQVSYYLGGRSFSTYNRSSDGTWTTTQPVGGLPAGPADLSWTVNWTDRFGYGHSAYSTRQVALDPTAVPLVVDQQSVSGEAPLDATLVVRASDPNGAELRVDVDWGDGVREQFALASPYEPLPLAHRYERAGAYRAFVSVSNGTGGYASQTVPVSANGRPNSAPQVDVATTPVTGVAPLDTTTTILATDAEGDPLTYRVDPGDGSAVRTGSLPSTGVQHRYEGAGTYLMRVQVSDGLLSVVRYVRITVGLSEPLRADAGDPLSVVVDTAVRLDGSASAPNAGITSASWDAGDGSGVTTGAVLDHVYRTTGTYTATLTVRSGTAVATDTTTVVVTDPPQAAGLTVRVTGGGSPLAGAQLVAVLPDGTRVSAVSVGSGLAVLPNLPDGPVTAYAAAPGHRPAVVTGTVRGGVGSATVDLAPGDVGAATLSSTPLTVEQIVAAGIDVSDPENVHVYEAEIHLYFEPSRDEPTPIHVYVSDEGVTCARDCEPDPVAPGCSPTAAVPCWYVAPSPEAPAGESGYTYYPQVQYVAGEPVIQWLVLPVRASFLKEFFSVELVVQNLTSLTFSGGSASLTLPQGLSLAPTAAAQTLQPSVADVPGGESRSVSWLVRGDVEGEYGLSADYVATVRPLDVPVRLLAVTSTPLKVWGASALQTTITVDDVAFPWAPYRVDVTIANVSDVPVYNLDFRLLPRPADWPAGVRAPYVLGPGAEKDPEPVGALAPCPTGSDPSTCAPARWSFVVYPGIGAGDTDTTRYYLTDSFVQRTGGDVDLRPTLQGRCPTCSDADLARLYPAPGDVTVEVDTDPAEDVARLSWPRPADLDDGSTPVEYVVWARQQLRTQTVTNDAWRVYDSVPAGAGAGALTVPSRDAGAGRYYAVGTRYSNGEVRWLHRVGVGPSRYVALGDSYSSGEGVPAFEPGTAADVSGGGNTCHRSEAGSYSRIISAAPPTGLNLEPATFAACSGAVTADVTAPNPANHEPPQLDSVSEFTDMITLSMGGNDIGFSDIGSACLLGDCTALLRSADLDPQAVATGLDAPFASPRWLNAMDTIWGDVSWLFAQWNLTPLSCQAMTDGASVLLCPVMAVTLLKALDGATQLNRDRVARPGYLTDGTLVERLAGVYSSLVDRAPHARLLVMPYPSIIGMGGSSTGMCQIGQFLDRRLGLTAGEVAALSNVLSLLNGAVDAAASRTNGRLAAVGSSSRIEVVSLGDVFAGGELCSGTTQGGAASMFNGLVNPLVPLGGNEGPVMYSLHPNATGQRAYAAALAAHLSPSTASTLQVISRPGATTQAGSITVQGSNLPLQGSPVSVQGVAQSSDLVVRTSWPGSTVTLRLTAPDGTLVTADSPGVTATSTATTQTLVVPSAQPGTWSLAVFGDDVDPAGEPTTVSAWEVRDPVAPPEVSVTGLRTDAGAPSFDLQARTSGAPVGATWSWLLSDGTVADGQQLSHTFSPEASAWWASVQLRLPDGTTSWGSVDLGGPRAAPVLIAPQLPSARVGSQYGVQLTASGRPLPRFTVASGQLPPGLTLDETTGLVGGVPTQGGSWTFTVAATNSVGSATSEPLTMVVRQTPVLAAAAPPAQLTAGTPVDYTFVATGSPAPVFAVEGQLPAGLTLASDGRLTGIPTYAGTSTWSVVATNEAGSVRSPGYSTVVAATRPGPVSGVDVVAADRSAVVSWAPPLSTGGSDVVGYTVTAVPGGETCTTSGATSCQVTGLTNGVGHTFTVIATNAGGLSSEASPSSGTVVPLARPGAPTAVAIAPADRALSVTWEEPSDSGGAAEVSYRVSTVPETSGCTVEVTRCELSGLTNGTSYLVVVTAATPGGQSAAGGVPGVPAGPPGAPTEVVAVPSDAALTASWTAPADTNGAAVVGYRATASPGDATCETTVTTCPLTGLTNGVAYRVTVTATNGPGRVSAPSTPSAAAVPVGAPGSPTAVVVVAGDASGEVSWSAPADTGGVPVERYEVVTEPGGRSCTTTSTSCRIDGLTNGVAHQVLVSAVNAAGRESGRASSAPFTPLGPPAAPVAVAVVAGDSSMRVSWVAATDDARRPATGYVVTSSPGGASCSTSDLSCTLTGLTNGVTYTVSVVAQDAAGTTGEPASSGPVRPLGAPSPPTAVQVTPGDGQLAASWTAPDDDGGASVDHYLVIVRDPDGGSSTCRTTETACAVASLRNGVAHSLSVVAVNEAEMTSAEAVEAGPWVPVGRPSSPRVLSVVPGDGQVAVTFSAADGNGAPVARYTVRSSGTATCTSTAALGCTITGLANGEPVTVTVTATNTAGLTSEASAPSTPVLPARSRQPPPTSNEPDPVQTPSPPGGSEEGPSAPVGIGGGGTGAGSSDGGSATDRAGVVGGAAPTGDRAASRSNSARSDGGLLATTGVPLISWLLGGIGLVLVGLALAIGRRPRQL